MAHGNKTYKIILIEPSPIVAAGMQEILSTRPEFEIIAIIADCCHYLERLNSLQPDIIILNPLAVDRKHHVSLDAIFADTSAVIVALIYQYVAPETLHHYHAIIDINDTREKIVQKLFRLVTTLAPSAPPEGEELSAREKEILVAVAKGMLNKEIADSHNISIHTVITHRKNISRKTGIKSVAGLTVFAILHNLIDINEIE